MARLAALVIVILGASTNTVDACECVSMPPCHKYWAADAVFTGVVTSVTYTADQKLSHTTLVVERGFREASGQVVITGQALSSCHYRFTVGQRYVVYARRSADGTLTTNECAGNTLLAEAAEDLDYAENVPPPGSGGRIFGRVRFVEEDLLDRRKSRDTFPAGKVVTLRDSSGARLALQTDSEGGFEATGLKPGSYTVSLDAPDSARVYYSQATIELKDRGCVPVDVSYQSNGRISGRIVDATGQAVSKVPVSAFPIQLTSKEDYPHVSMHTKWTDSAGRYEIGPLPPGEYHIAVNLELPGRLESPYPVTYFPGVRGRGDAKAITIREGDVQRADFVLPQRLAQVTVSGSVVFPDGTPAPNVDVRLIAGTVLVISSVRTDASGTFTVTGLSDSTYLLRASFHASPDNNSSAETSVSLRDEAVVGLKLILQKH